MAGTTAKEPKEPLVDRVLSHFVIRNDLIRSMLCELFSSVFYFFMSCSANSQLKFDGRNDWLGYMVALCFCLILSIQMATVGSGGHMNPAISFFLFMNGRLPFTKLISFIIMQTLGAFAGSSLSYFMYYDTIDTFDGGIRRMSGEYATNFIYFPSPKNYDVIWKAFIEEIIGGCVLGITGTMVYDPSVGVSKTMQPMLAGLGIALSGMAFNMTAGFELNPARYLGNRLFTLCVGYGKNDTGIKEAAWFWIPVFGPMIGTTVGSFLFKIFIGVHAKAAKAAREVAEAAKENSAPLDGTKPRTPVQLTSVFVIPDYAKLNGNSLMDTAIFRQNSAPVPYPDRAIQSYYTDLIAHDLAPAIEKSPK